MKIRSGAVINIQEIKSTSEDQQTTSLGSSVSPDQLNTSPGLATETSCDMYVFSYFITSHYVEKFQVLNIYSRNVHGVVVFFQDGYFQPAC